MLKVKIKRKSDEIALPEYETIGSSGADVRAYLSESITLSPFAFTLIPTGLYLEIPMGYEIQVRPRSGLSRRKGITVLNTPGTIDSDYRGELQIILINLGQEDFVIQNGDRIAQLVIAPVTKAEFLITEELEESDRGEGGFGSTGVK